MQKITKYKIVQKDHYEIPLDEDEVDAVKEALKSGGIIQTRAAIFDSAYIARLVVDDERTEACTYKTVDATGKIVITTEKLDDLFKKNKTHDSQQSLPETIKSLELGQSPTVNNATPEQIKEAVRLAREKREELKNCTLRE